MPRIQAGQGFDGWHRKKLQLFSHNGQRRDLREETPCNTVQKCPSLVSDVQGYDIGSLVKKERAFVQDKKTKTVGQAKKLDISQPDDKAEGEEKEDDQGDKDDEDDKGVRRRRRDT